MNMIEQLLPFQEQQINMSWKMLTLSLIPTSKRLDRLFLLLGLLCLRKYFWAWLATWVGVLVVTKFLEIPLQSPFPSFSSPARNVLCSSSVHGIPSWERWNRSEIKLDYNHDRRCSYLAKIYTNDVAFTWIMSELRPR